LKSYSLNFPEGALKLMWLLKLPLDQKFNSDILKIQ